MRAVIVTNMSIKPGSVCLPNESVVNHEKTCLPSPSHPDNDGSRRGYFTHKVLKLDQAETANCRQFRIETFKEQVHRWSYETRIQLHTIVVLSVPKYVRGKLVEVSVMKTE